MQGIRDHVIGAALRLMSKMEKESKMVLQKLRCKASEQDWGHPKINVKDGKRVKNGTTEAQMQGIRAGNMGVGRRGEGSHGPPEFSYMILIK